MHVTSYLKTTERHLKESLFLPLLSKCCPPVVTKARHNMKTIFNLSLLIFVIHLYYKCITALHNGAKRCILLSRLAFRPNCFADNMNSYVHLIR